MNLNLRQKGKRILKFTFFVFFAIFLGFSYFDYPVSAKSNRTYTMTTSNNNQVSEVNNLMSLQNNGFASETSQESRIETFTISIPQLGDRSRNIQVYLPPGYDSSEKAYPVFYLHAGQYLFNPPPTANGDYNVNETLDKLFFEGLIDGLIVVGIEIDYEYDWIEYSPWVNEDMHDWVSTSASDSVEGGEGFAFLDFIVNTLKPEIDSRYRTLTNRENTAIGGFCKNGLLPVIAGVKYSNVFSKVMSMSPAVWYAEGGGLWLSNNRLIQYLVDNPLPENVKFYIDIGSDESTGRRPRVKDQDGERITYPQAYVEGAEVLANVLQENGVPESNIYFQIIEGSTGSRDDRAKNFDEVILWFFGGENAKTIPTHEFPTDVEPPNEEDPHVSESPTQNEEVEDPYKIEDRNIGSAIILGSILVVCCFAAVYLVFRKR